MTGKTNQKKTDGEISIPEVNDTFPDDEAILEEMADELTEDLDADIEVGFTDDPDEDLPEEAADDDALLDDLSESRLKDAEFDERLAKLVKNGKNNKNEKSRTSDHCDHHCDPCRDRHHLAVLDLGNRLLGGQLPGNVQRAG